MAAFAPPRRRDAGFTLVEVMVALVIMAILAALAFRGIDALLRARERSQRATDRTLKLDTGLSQYEYDVAQIVNSHVLPNPVMFDGATLRIARRAPDGIQLVAWSLQDGRWLRWASPATTRMSELTDAWMRSQQWSAIGGNAIAVLDDVDAFQVYLCNPASATGSGGCSWNNVQSTQGTAAGGGTNGGTSGATGTAVAQPVAIRIALKVAGADLTRDRELPRW